MSVGGATASSNAFAAARVTPYATSDSDSITLHLSSTAYYAILFGATILFLFLVLINMALLLALLRIRRKNRASTSKHDPDSSFINGATPSLPPTSKNERGEEYARQYHEYSYTKRQARRSATTSIDSRWNSTPMAQVVQVGSEAGFQGVQSKNGISTGEYEFSVTLPQESHQVQRIPTPFGVQQMYAYEDSRSSRRPSHASFTGSATATTTYNVNFGQYKFPATNASSVTPSPSGSSVSTIDSNNATKSQSPRLFVRTSKATRDLKRPSACPSLTPTTETAVTIKQRMPSKSILRNVESMHQLAYGTMGSLRSSNAPTEIMSLTRSEKGVKEDVGRVRGRRSVSVGVGAGKGRRQSRRVSCSLDRYDDDWLFGSGEEEEEEEVEVKGDGGFASRRQRHMSVYTIDSTV